jgi:hypothetical protein
VRGNLANEDEVGEMGEKRWVTDPSYFWDYVLLQPTYRELPAEFWRDTSPSYYLLNGPKIGNRQFIDGADTSDIPDFHSVDISVPRGITGANASYLVDRFGNQYISVGPTIGFGTGGFAYSEGYICAHGESPDCFFLMPPR